MIQEVKFQGLSHSPSDYEAQDGELGTCLNLINENGTLKPIAKPKIVYKDITLPEGARIVFVHKVTHDNEIHCHYIIKRKYGTWYWIENNNNTEYKELDLNSSYQVNSVTAIGNILCFVCETNIIYFNWRNNQYFKFEDKDVKYSINIETEQYYINNGQHSNNFENFWECVTNDAYLETKANKMLELFNAGDALSEKYITEHGNDYLKGIVFGVAALRTYDGEHINFSNLFILPPCYMPKTVVCNTDTGNVVVDGNAHRHKIKINISNFDDTIIDGIDIFLTKGEYFFNFEKKYKGEKWNGSNNYNFKLEYLNSEEIYKKIDGLTFFHSLHISNQRLIEQDSFYLKRPIGTEQSLSLANMNRQEFGGRTAISYNNRLHIADISLGNLDLKSYRCEYKYIISKFQTHITTGSSIYDNRIFIDAYPEIRLIQGDLNPDYENGVTIECFMYVKSDTRDYLYFFDDNIQYPLPPILSFPITDGNYVKIYVKHPEGKFYKCKLDLYRSETMGASYYVNNGDKRFFENIQVFKIDLDSEGNFYKTETPNSYWEEITESDFSEDYNYYKKNIVPTKRQQSLLRVSEAENPFVFPAKNSVQVGSSVINALSANTRPISEGQFGEAPLYAFTDEGVWVLMTNSEGTYDARQPANREICTNPKGILQIDDAVLFPTDRGIMMQQGRDSICITDQLDGFPFDFTQLYKEEYAKKILSVGKIDEESVKYAQLRKFLDDGVNKADMIYDYYDSRIILFNPAYQYAYVYSLKSKMWGTMENNFTQRVNIYPESYAIDKNGKIVDLYVKNPTEDVPYFLCSRPLAISSNEVYKTMLSCIARGYFRGSEKGKCGMALFGSNDLFHWFPIKTSVNKYLRGMAGSPYKYFRIALVGSLSPDESISGLSTDFIERWQNKLR